MNRILLDQNAPRGLRRALAPRSVTTAVELGWSEIANGLLVTAAEEAGFAILITCDQNMCYQLARSDRRLSMIVLQTDKWPVIRKALERVVVAVDAAIPGSLASIPFDRPLLRRRPPPVGFNR